MYIPPENSIYSSIDFFDVIEDNILKFVAEKNCKVCLLSDFNARSGTKISSSSGALNFEIKPHTFRAKIFNEFLFTVGTLSF
jgi:hypothetical protein